MGKAENQETAVETKNTEVKANLDGQEAILIIPAAKPGYQGLQPTKSKEKGRPLLTWLEKAPRKKCLWVLSADNELIQGFLRLSFKS